MQKPIRRPHVHPAEHAAASARRCQEVRRPLRERKGQENYPHRRLHRPGQHNRSYHQASERRRRQRGKDR